jgi:RNA polymerase sigma factor (sigma-70 family)
MRRWLSSHSSTQTADLDDVAQEVFERLSGYSDAALAEHPQSYFLDIAANVVNEWRARTPNSPPPDDTRHCDPQKRHENESERSVEQTPIEVRVRNAVSRLPQRQREVILLHVKDDLTYKQIAAKLNLPPRVVLRDIARAYAQLRRDLPDPSVIR